MKIPKSAITFALLLAFAPLSGVSQSSQTGSSTERQGQSAPSAEPRTGAQSDRQGNQPGRHTAIQASGKHSADHEFIEKTAQSGMAEVELAKLAQEKASNNDVKQYAEKLASDHSRANEELKKIAEEKNAEIPPSVGPIHHATNEKLSKLSGAEFDSEYINQMMANHRTGIAEFKHQASSGHDQDLKQFASKSLPTLEQHLKMAEEIHAKLEGGASKSEHPGGSGAYGSSGQSSPGTGGSSNSPSGSQSDR